MNPCIYTCSHGFRYVATYTADDAAVWARSRGAVGVEGDDDGLLPLDGATVEQRSREVHEVVCRVDGECDVRIERVTVFEREQCLDEAVYEAIRPLQMLTVEDIADKLRQPMRDVRKAVWRLRDEGQIESRQVAAVTMWRRTP